MTRTLLLAVHIIGVAAWLGANFVQLVLTPRFARGPATEAAAWTRQTIWMGQGFYGPAGAVVGISGVALVLTQDWSWSAGFIWIGVAVLVIGAGMGVLMFGPLAETRLAALESGDEAAASAAQSRIIPFALLDTALIVAAILAMVHKWMP